MYPNTILVSVCLLCLLLFIYLLKDGNTINWECSAPPKIIQPTYVSYLVIHFQKKAVVTVMLLILPLNYYFVCLFCYVLLSVFHPGCWYVGAK